MGARTGALGDVQLRLRPPPRGDPAPSAAHAPVTASTDAGPAATGQAAVGLHLVLDLLGLGPVVGVLTADPRRPVVVELVVEAAEVRAVVGVLGVLGVVRLRLVGVRVRQVERVGEASQLVDARPNSSMHGSQIIEVPLRNGRFAMATGCSQFPHMIA